MKSCLLVGLLVGGSTGAATSCQPTSRPVQPCLHWAPANAPLDVFDLDRPPTPLDTTSRSTLSYAQRRTLLHDADGVKCCLTTDAMHDSTYVGAYFYATVARLTRVKQAPCQVLIHASMDDFSGLYLVLQPAGKPSASLYVAGNEGAGGTEEDGLFHSPRITTGRMLTDSLVQVTTRADCMAFRHSGQHSYTEATINVFRLDYRTATFRLIRHQDQHLPLAKLL